MGIVGTYPAVFARVANKEVAGYGLGRAYGRWEVGTGTGERGEDREKVRKSIWLEGCAPLFFVSVI
jgi:hypothetical protein